MGSVDRTAAEASSFVFDTSSDAFVIADERGTIQAWNEGAQRMFGYALAEVRGQPLTVLMPERFRERHSLAFERRTGGAHESERFERTVELMGLRKGGVEFAVEIAISGRVVDGHHAFTAVLRDVSNRARTTADAVRYEMRLAEERAARLAAEHLRGEATAQANRLLILAEASRLFSSASTNLDNTLSVIATRCAELIGDMCTIQLLDESRTRFRVMAFHHRDPGALAWGRELLMGHDIPRMGISAAVVETSQPTSITVSDPEELRRHASPPRQKFLERYPMYSVIAMPLRVGGQTLGTMTLGRHTPGSPYEESDRSLLQDLSDRAGLALESALSLAREIELRRQAEASAERTGRLQQMTAALSGLMTPIEAANTALDHSMGLFEGATSAKVFLTSDDGRMMRLLSHKNVRDSLIARMLHVSVDDDLSPCMCARTGEPVFFETLAQTLEALPRLPERLGAPVHALASFATPLRVHGRRVGVVWVGFREERSFAPGDRAFIRIIGDTCAQAIHRAVLGERERDNLERTVFLAQAGEQLASLLDHEAIPTALTKLIVPRLADWCTVELLDGEDARQVAVAHRDSEKEPLAWELREKFPPHQASRGGVHEVLRTGKAMHHENLGDAVLVELAEDPEQLRLGRVLGMHAVLVLPLVARGVRLGAVSLVAATAERRFAEADVQLATELVRRASLAMDNARLYRELENSVRVRDDFLAVAGHELKTPLAATLLHTQSVLRLARRDGTTPRLVERLCKAEASTLRLERLIDELLDVSRITSGRLRLELDSVNLSDVADEVVATYNDETRLRGCSLLARIEPDVVGVLDRLRVQQVVGNLVDNALKYGRSKPVELELTREDEWATFRVSDHGIGIEPGQQSRIFERFERAVTTREFGGFGLGLWIVRQIVEAMGGEIGLASTPGRGSVFSVRLPLAPRGG